MLVRVYAFIHYPELPDCVSTLSAYFYFIALKDKSIMVKCKPHQAQKQLHYTANKISAIIKHLH